MAARPTILFSLVYRARSDGKRIIGRTSLLNPDFFLIANQPPRSLDNIQFYRWSRKLDGIRICINGFENAITRNGIILQIPNLATVGHHETTKLDAELIYKNDDETSYSLRIYMILQNYTYDPFQFFRIL